MRKRNIVEIDEEKCTGCGLCVPSCAEGAIQIIDGKAKLVADVLCDGLGACLGDCPEDAIRIIEREADEFDEEEVKAHLSKVNSEPPRVAAHAGGCPGSRSMSLGHGGCPGSQSRSLAIAEDSEDVSVQSKLATWPVQLTLVSPHAPYLSGADLLLAADCVPFAYADFHQKLLRGRPVLIGCPKLDNPRAYVDKLTEILEVARPTTLTVAHMEVPCCMGIQQIARMAILQSDSEVELRVVVVGIRGDIQSDEVVAI